MDSKIERDFLRCKIENNCYRCLLALDGLSSETIVAFFKKNNFRRIALYGINNIAKYLFFFLKKYDIECIGIDKNALGKTNDMTLFGSDDKWPDCDIFIVTGELYYDEIKDKILQKSPESMIIRATDFLNEIVSIPQKE